MKRAYEKHDSLNFTFFFKKQLLFLTLPSICLSAGDPKSWQNKSLPGDPNYLVGANCVSVLIDHF